MARMLKVSPKCARWEAAKRRGGYGEGAGTKRLAALSQKAAAPVQHDKRPLQAPAELDKVWFYNAWTTARGRTELYVQRSHGTS